MASSVVTSAAQWIASLLIQEASLLLGVEDQVRGLQEELELMQEYLQDADAKQQVREVRALIGQIRRLAYDAEDVIDTYILKVQSIIPINGSRVVRYACRLYNTPNTYRVVKQIQVIQSGAKRITEKLNGYGVRRITELPEGLRSTGDQRCRGRQKLRTYPYDEDNDEYVVGLEKDIAKLVEVLMGEGKTQINVLAIVGMGGYGKTTLARKLYNHPYTKECFDCKAWVFISQEWSTHHVLSEILRKVGGPEETSKAHQKSSVEELVDKLRNILEKKSYLVVLDDVWRGEALHEILPALPRGSVKRGSKVIITTRNRKIINVKNLQRCMHVHEPRPLNDEEGWELFSRIALSHHTKYDMGSFESLGKEMLKKCDGLPLAIVALAGILNTRKSIREWQQVSEAVRSRVMEGTCTHMYGKVGDLLALSYDDLPYDLKPCFLYLGVFPEDYQIPAGMLIRMWTAEGLIIAREERSLEDVGMQRLEELSHRFMIQVVKSNFKGEIKAIRLHDLLRDLCVKKAKEQSFLQVCSPVNDTGTSDASVLANQPRRFALHSSVSFPTEMSNLRSFVLLARSSLSQSSYFSKETLNLEVVHKNFKLLRLLNLWGIKTVKGTLPTQIGSLVHLRYLGICDSNIRKLPASVGNLRNLLTLDYRNIESNINEPIKIPNVLWKLELLRHLFLPIEGHWDVQDLQLSGMKNLRSLWGIKQDKSCNWISREVPKLSSTLKKLKVSVSTESEIEAVLSCPSLVSDGLHTFHCELRESLAFQRVLNPISHHQHLHKLVLVGHIKMNLSLLLPSNLVKLELKDSMLITEDPMEVIGVLAHLKVLRLSNSYMGTSSACKSGSFPQLEELYLENFQNLKRWTIEKGAMLCLKKLEVVECWNLRDFPQGLTFIPSLQQFEFFGVPKEFAQKATENGWAQKNLRLPKNCEAIIKQCDCFVETSSISKLYEQLSDGVFLNNKKQRYWVMKKDDCYYNCFMAYASKPLVRVMRLSEFDTWLEDSWRQSEALSWNVDDNVEAEYTEVREREEGTFITAIKLKQYPPQIVSGKFNTVNLSLQVTYEVAWVIKVEGRLYGILVDEVELADAERKPDVYFRLTLPDGSNQEHQEKLNNKPNCQWIEVPIGKFEMSPQISGDVEMSLRFDLQCNPSSVLIKGFLIRPEL